MNDKQTFTNRPWTLRKGKRQGHHYENSVGMNLMLSCAALIAAQLIPALALAQHPAAIAVRSTGETDVVAECYPDQLLYSWATPGSDWQAATITNDFYPETAPAIAVRSTGEADVVIEGPNNELVYYHSTNPSTWYANTIGEAGTTFSAPAIAVRSTGEADVVAQGPHNELFYYHAIPGAPWNLSTIAPAGTTFSAPHCGTLDWRGGCGSAGSQQ